MTLLFKVLWAQVAQSKLQGHMHPGRRRVMTFGKIIGFALSLCLKSGVYKNWSKGCALMPW